MKTSKSGMSERTRRRIELACRPVNNVVVVSDLHFGCQFGLFTKDTAFALDGGGGYMPSKLQQTVAAWWHNFWHEWVPTVTRGEPYAVVVNGDIVDGRHHNSTTQITQNLADQDEMAVSTFKPIVKEAAYFFMVRGTPAHVGEAAENEEKIAKRLNAVPDKEGHHSRPELWLKVGDGLVHFLHHIGTASAAAYETTALMREYGESCAEAGRWGHKAPDIIVRSHRHRHSEIRVPTSTGYGTCFTTAGWQLRTPFCYRISGARLQMPQMGGSLIRWGDEELYTRHKTWNIQRGEPEVMTI